MKITIEGNFDAEDLRLLRYLLRDALSDFMNARRGDYVERRYAGQSEEFKARKRNDVAGRLLLAARLHQADMEIKDNS